MEEARTGCSIGGIYEKIYPSENNGFSERDRKEPKMAKIEMCLTAQPESRGELAECLCAMIGYDVDVATISTPKCDIIIAHQGLVIMGNVDMFCEYLGLDEVAEYQNASVEYENPNMRTKYTPRTFAGLFQVLAKATTQYEDDAVALHILGASWHAPNVHDIISFLYALI